MFSNKQLFTFVEIRKVTKYYITKDGCKNNLNAHYV